MSSKWPFRLKKSDSFISSLVFVNLFCLLDYVWKEVLVFVDLSDLPHIPAMLWYILLSSHILLPSLATYLSFCLAANFILWIRDRISTNLVLRVYTKRFIVNWVLVHIVRRVIQLYAKIRIEFIFFSGWFISFNICS